MTFPSSDIRNANITKGLLIKYLNNHILFDFLRGNEPSHKHIPRQQILQNPRYLPQLRRRNMLPVHRAGGLPRYPLLYAGPAEGVLADRHLNHQQKHMLSLTSYRTTSKQRSIARRYLPEADPQARRNRSDRPAPRRRRPRTDSVRSPCWPHRRVHKSRAAAAEGGG